MLAILIFVGCKKYPDGGYLIHINKIPGPYRIDELTVNGIDSTSSFNGNPCYCNRIFQFSFVEDNGFGAKLQSNCGTFPTNTWQIAGDRRQILITFVYTASAGSLYPFIVNQNTTITWDIQRLKKDDLWLKTNLNGKEYYLKLVYTH